jgi:hypothetical protein
MECILGGGRYFLSPFVAQHGGGRYMDIREGMATLMVASERNVSAVVELPHQLCVERSPAGAQPSAASGATA